MEKLIHLFWGIITKPWETFKEIKEIRPIREGIAIMLFSLLLSNLLLWLHPAIYELKRLSALYIIFNFFMGIVILLVLTSILNYLAKTAKLESNYQGILNIFLFASSPYIITFPVSLLFAVSKIVVLQSIIHWGTLLWCIVLVVIGVSAVLSVPTKRSLGLCLRAFLMLFLAVILLGLVFGMIRSQIRKSISSDVAPVKGITETKRTTESLKPIVQEFKSVQEFSEEKLREIIMSLAHSSNINIDTMNKEDKFLEVKGVMPKDMQALNDFIRALQMNYKVKTKLYSVVKIDDNNIGFTLNCYYTTQE